MATKKKMLQAAAGNATGGAGLDITDVFSTYLYEGNGSTQTITNDIDLAGEGGLVWIKNRSRPGYSTSFDHVLYDTERGAQYTLFTPDTTPSSINTTGLTSFNEDGFSLGGSSRENWNGGPTVSWSFRKAPKFFDVVTYTGTGSPQSILHDLGCTVGSIFIKNMDVGHDWKVYHVGNTSSPETKALELNKSGASESGSVFWNNTAPTSTQFTVGTDETVNSSGVSYVAYLFAHNDGDGGFGPSGDQDIIKCGSFTGPSATVNLGFEPEWILMKDTAGSSNWIIYDAMRGMPVGSTPQELYPNTSGAESLGGNFGHVSPSPTGFSVGSGYSATYIYIAIRRGPLAPPESGTEVFDVDAQAGGSFVTTNFPVDMQINRNRTFASGAVAISRLTGGRALDTSSTGAEGGASYFEFDHQNGIEDNYQGIDGCIYWSFKRAPNFCDVVAYTGTSSTSTFKHNLGVKPEMIWVKGRNVGTYGWYVYHEAVTANDQLYLHLTNAAGGGFMANTEPTAEVFTLGNTTGANNSSYNYIAYLFATLPGVSKVGSYTGNGTSQTIDCGFTSGARFILIKRTDSTGDWYVWDTERGIVAGNDPHLSLNTTAAEVTSDDSIDPDSSGFIVNQVGATNINVSSAEYIFYAIA